MGPSLRHGLRGPRRKCGRAFQRSPRSFPKSRPRNLDRQSLKTKTAVWGNSFLENGLFAVRERTGSKEGWAHGGREACAGTRSSTLLAHVMTLGTRCADTSTPVSWSKSSRDKNPRVEKFRDSTLYREAHPLKSTTWLGFEHLAFPDPCSVSRAQPDQPRTPTRRSIDGAELVLVAVTERASRESCGTAPRLTSPRSPAASPPRRREAAIRTRWAQDPTQTPGSQTLCRAMKPRVSIPGSIEEYRATEAHM